MKEMRCIKCNAPFKYYSSMCPNRKYCSHQCRRIKREANCLFCKKEILFTRHIKSFCNISCSKKYKWKDYYGFDCKDCGRITKLQKIGRCYSCAKRFYQLKQNDLLAKTCASLMLLRRAINGNQEHRTVA